MADDEDVSRRGAAEPSQEFGSLAIAVLALLRERDRLLPAEIRRQIEMSPAALNRLLATLNFQGLLTRLEGGAYAAGPVLIELALAVVRRIDLRTLARPHLVRLSQELGETVHLMALHGREALFLDSIESAKVLRVGSRIGQTLPAHGSAGGKILLACLSDREVLDLYGDEALPRVTARTLATRETLLRELATVRAQGFASNFGETESDIVAVAVPIRGDDGKALGSLSLSAPASRFDLDGQPGVVAALASAAAEIGANRG